MLGSVVAFNIPFQEFIGWGFLNLKFPIGFCAKGIPNQNIIINICALSFKKNYSFLFHLAKQIIEIYYLVISLYPR